MGVPSEGRGAGGPRRLVRWPLMRLRPRGRPRSPTPASAPRTRDGTGRLRGKPSHPAPGPGREAPTGPSPRRDHDSTLVPSGSLFPSAPGPSPPLEPRYVETEGQRGGHGTAELPAATADPEARTSSTAASARPPRPASPHRRPSPRTCAPRRAQNTRRPTRHARTRRSRPFTCRLSPRRGVPVTAAGRSRRAG